MAHELSDEVLLALLREAAKQVQQNVSRSRAVVEETHGLLRLAERIEAPLIGSR